MKITFSPKGEAPREWSIDLEDVPVSHGEVIEKRMGGQVESYAMWVALVQVGNARARRVLLWYLQWLDHPSLRFEQVDFRSSELKIDMEAHEVRAMLAEARAVKPRDDETRRQVEQRIENLEAELAELEGEAAASPPVEVPARANGWS